MTAVFSAHNKAILYQARDTFILSLISLTVPLAVHAIPVFGDMPAGLRLLPLFYAPFIAAMLSKPQVGLSVAVLAPVLNSMITGLPRQDQVVSITLELALFVLLVVLCRRIRGVRWGIAPICFIVMKILLCLFGWTQSNAPYGAFLDEFLRTSAVSAPGIFMLLLINILLAHYEKKESGIAGH